MNEQTTSFVAGNRRKRPTMRFENFRKWATRETIVRFEILLILAICGAPDQASSCIFSHVAMFGPVGENWEISGVIGVLGHAEPLSPSAISLAPTSLRGETESLTKARVHTRYLRDPTSYIRRADAIKFFSTK